MKIHLASDLHLDIHTLPKGVPVNWRGGVLLLAGDTCETRSLKNPYVVEDLARICAAYDQVFTVTGNHEYYNGDINLDEDLFKQRTAHIPNLRLLQKESVDLGSVKLIAATLWTDLNKGDPFVKGQGRMLLNDYRRIDNAPSTPYNHNPVLTTQDTCLIHKDHLNFITEEILSSDKCIVMTHHAPILEHINRKRGGYVSNDVTGFFYCSDLSQLILDNTNKIKLWAHGHTHEEKQTWVDKTLVATNARGYSPFEFEPMEINIE